MPQSYTSYTSTPTPLSFSLSPYLSFSYPSSVKFAESSVHSNNSIAYADDWTKACYTYKQTRYLANTVDTHVLCHPWFAYYHQSPSPLVCIVRIPNSGSMPLFYCLHLDYGISSNLLFFAADFKAACQVHLQTEMTFLFTNVSVLWTT